MNLNNLMIVELMTDSRSLLTGQEFLRLELVLKQHTDHKQKVPESINCLKATW